MATAPRKKARKGYLHQSQEFCVPKSTYYERQKNQRLQRALDEPGPSSTVESSDALNLTPQLDDVPAPADTLEDSLLGDNPADGNRLDDGVEETATARDFEYSSSGDVADDAPPQLTEDEVLFSTFAKLSGEKLPNLGTSKAGATAMAMSFAMAHRLTWSALGDLAKLVNSIAGTEVLPRSQYVFRKLWSTQKDELVQRWYMCKQCGDVLKIENGIGLCEVCGTKVQVAKDAEALSFVTLNARKQLCTLVESTKKSLAEGLAARNHRCDDLVTDITSAASFHHLWDSEGLREDDLTVTINTDGSPVFKSSKTSIWPLQLIVNELPPDVRFKHPVLVGLWFGPVHPKMQTFLARFVSELASVGQIVWEHENHLHHSRVFVLCCAVDAPARATVLNLLQFNGVHGCPRCFSRTIHSEGSTRYTGQVLEPRTHNGVVRDMHMAFVTDEIFNGFKGPSALMNLQGFNLVSGISVDYMHCVLQGVCKQVTELVFTKPNIKPDRDKLRTINQRLLSIQPPHCVTRLPRPIDERSHWKASEWRNWLLYYAGPCLEDMLPQENWRHLLKLSEAVHILLRESLSADDIDRAERLLLAFVERCEPLYGTAAATFNVHSLLHLADNVRDLGPLWANSAFVFEGGNGKLVKSVTAANGLPHQIVERVAMGQCLENFIAATTVTEEDKAICQQFLGHAQVSNAVQEEDATLLGHNRRALLTASETDALNEGGYDDVECYERLIVRHQVFHSTLYKKPVRSDTTFIETVQGCFRIEKVVRVSFRGGHKCLLLCREVLFLDRSSFPEHIRPCFLSGSGVTAILPPSDILRSCIFVEFSQEKKAFLCLMPNMIERD